MSDKKLVPQEVFNELKPALSQIFGNLSNENINKAIVEAIAKGFTAENFLKKDVYAIPFSGSYSLVTSIGFARKIATRTGLFAGVTKPEYEMGEDGKIISCSITVKKIVQGIVCDFASEVFFSEYYKAGPNGKPSKWDSMPRTMISKVAEMHALRKAFPEEITEYDEDEIKQEKIVEQVDLTEWRNKIESAENLEQLGKIWSIMPPLAKKELQELTQLKKESYENPEIQLGGGVDVSPEGEDNGIPA